MYYLSLNSQ